jgi:hypothetical protein
VKCDVLRASIAAAGIVLLAVGAVAGAYCSLAASLRLALPGLLLVGAVVLERWRYKRLREDRPGSNWIATNERFIDPETGRRVTVYFDPASGERRYVAS